MTTGTVTVPNDLPPVVALVASTGGLAAVSRILRRLPGGFAASVIVLIHMQPGQASGLVGILARRCPLPVVEARHDVGLEPGVVTVVPPGRRSAPARAHPTPAGSKRLPARRNGISRPAASAANSPTTPRTGRPRASSRSARTAKSSITGA
jgi:chemotaxis response regulator CheB